MRTPNYLLEYGEIRNIGTELANLFLGCKSLASKSLPKAEEQIRYTKMTTEWSERLDIYNPFMEVSG